MGTAVSTWNTNLHFLNMHDTYVTTAGQERAPSPPCATGMKVLCIESAHAAQELVSTAHRATAGRPRRLSHTPATAV